MPQSAPATESTFGLRSWGPEGWRAPLGRARAQVEALDRHRRRREEAAALLVVCHDAAAFPDVRPAAAAAAGGGGGGEGGGGGGEGGFDRVLADVPCSGDGTVRKDPGAGRAHMLACVQAQARRARMRVSAGRWGGAGGAGGTDLCQAGQKGPGRGDHDHVIT